MTTTYYYRFRWAPGMVATRRNGEQFTVTAEMLQLRGALLTCPRKMTYGCHAIFGEYRIFDDCISLLDIVTVTPIDAGAGTEPGP